MSVNTTVSEEDINNLDVEALKKICNQMSFEERVLYLQTIIPPINLEHYRQQSKPITL